MEPFFQKDNHYHYFVSPFKDIISPNDDLLSTLTSIDYWTSDCCQVPGKKDILFISNTKRWNRAFLFIREEDTQNPCLALYLNSAQQKYIPLQQQLNLEIGILVEDIQIKEGLYWYFFKVEKNVNLFVQPWMILIHLFSVRSIYYDPCPFLIFNKNLYNSIQDNSVRISMKTLKRFFKFFLTGAKPKKIQVIDKTIGDFRIIVRIYLSKLNIEGQRFNVYSVEESDVFQILREANPKILSYYRNHRWTYKNKNKEESKTFYEIESFLDLLKKHGKRELIQELSSIIKVIIQM